MAKGQANSQIGEKYVNKNPQSSIAAMDTKFILDDIKRIHKVENNPEPTTLMHKDELLRWHYNLGYCQSKGSSLWPSMASAQGGWPLAQGQCVLHASLASRQGDHGAPKGCQPHRSEQQQSPGRSSPRIS